MLNGHGVWITDTGVRYEGEFVNNIMVSPQRPRVIGCPAPSEFVRPPDPLVQPTPPSSPDRQPHTEAPEGGPTMVAPENPPGANPQHSP